MTRAFVAIVPPDAVLDAVAARLRGVDLGEVRLTRREQWHVTIQFLGNEADVEAIIAGLQGLRVRASRVWLEGIGPVDGTRGRGTVLGLGVRPLD
ncbi:MAG TPA: 2'-5' RNA ligase family protein, partial [Acidimicrobiia bacterium]|nr:2'-5' RNA ligase family protein [Acidimicrobiia bacterium]